MLLSATLAMAAQSNQLQAKNAGYATGAFGQWGLGETNLQGVPNPLTHWVEESDNCPYVLSQQHGSRWH
jgi:arylsulfatase A-like enzyme